MKHTTTDGGVGSGGGSDQSELRSNRSVWKISGVTYSVGVMRRVSVHRACGAASGCVVQRGGWPALSVNGGSAHLKRKGGRTVAASRDSRLTWVARGPAALGGVGVGQAFEGTHERTSQRRCLKLVKETTDDAGDGLAPRVR
jgi:hypothetical protein